MNKTTIYNILLISIIPILFIISTFDFKIAISTTVLMALALIAVIFFIVDCIRNHRNLFSKKGALIIAVILLSVIISFAYQITYMMKGIYYFGSVVQQINTILFLIIGLYLYRFHFDQFNKSLHIISWLGFASALHALFEELIFFSNNGILTRVFSVYNNPIPAGTVWVLCIFLPLTGKIVLDLVMKVVYLVAIFLCMSRSAWLALLLGLFLFVVINKNTITKLYVTIKRPIRIILWILLLTIIIGLLQIPEVSEVITTRLFHIKTGPVSEAYSVRTTHSVYLLDIFFHCNPIFWITGHGPGSTVPMFMSSPYWELDHYNVVDNSYLSVLYEYGIVMIIAIVYILFLAFRKLYYKFRSESCISNEDAIYALMFICGAVTAFFYDLQYIMAPTLMMMIMTATVITSKEDKTA
ncbi:hypothetical protein SAMN02745229_03787 [Butyrivibrio fibrisolvens DSM 3071]|uniref:O-antigen ligase-related domain-containing protein n=2 Tax=Butyrivibrio fibrisolvens TaxID=831 RepID=A0A1M6ETJ4_BUTFI|nr:hypothetical protein SAMN02745229_03787 [Butyrivibrio fibrisolvens DSM 3071]